MHYTLELSNEDEDQLNYYISTSATSGVITTQYFNEQYQPSLVERKVNYVVFVSPPESVKNNTNVTLHFNLEKISMTGLSKGWDITNVNGRSLEAGLKSVSVDFNPPAGAEGYREVLLARKIEEDSINIKMESMPGFRLSWYYTGLGDNVTPDSWYSYSQENQLFIRSVRVSFYRF